VGRAVEESGWECDDVSLSLPFKLGEIEGGWKGDEKEEKTEERLMRRVLQVLPRCCGRYVLAVCGAADYGACGG